MESDTRKVAVETRADTLQRELDEQHARDDQAEARCAKAYEEQERLRQLLNRSDRDFAEFRREYERVKLEREKLQVDLDACRRELERADERYAHRVREETGTMEIAGDEYVVVPRKRWEEIMRELPVRLTPAEASKHAVDQLEKAAGVQQDVPAHIVKEVEDRSGPDRKQA